jgi:hypothetical protein
MKSATVVADMDGPLVSGVRGRGVDRVGSVEVTEAHVLRMPAGAHAANESAG